MTRKELIAAIHRGAYNANKIYCEWSGGAWVTDYGIESLMTVEICRAIQRKRQTGYLTMEEHFDTIIQSSDEKAIGRRPEILKSSNRVDIALWNSGESITHVIEVKRHWNDACYRDIERIYWLQNKVDSIQCGLFIMNVVVEGERTELANKVNAAKDTIDYYLSEYKHRVHLGTDDCKPFQDGDWIGTSVCLETYGRS